MKTPHEKVILFPGTSSTSRVRRAQCKQSGVLRAVRLANATTSGKLHAEYNILARLDHPHICRLVEYFPTKRTRGLVVELCDGGDLIERALEADVFDEALAAHYMHGLLSGVSYLHANGIIHRDISPINLLLDLPTADAKLKIADLGHAVDCAFGAKLAWDDFLPVPHYCAPETGARHYDHAIDVFSCGVVLHLLLLGRPVVDGNSERQIRNRMKQLTPEDILNEPEDMETISDLAADLIRKLLAIKPQDRITAADALSHEWFHHHYEHVLPTNVLRRLRAFRGKQVFIQAVSTFIAVRLLSTKQRSQLAEHFERLDTNHDGTISLDELEKELPHEIAARASDKFSALDHNRDGRVDYTEFLVAMLDSETLVAQQNLQQAFDAFDLDRDGKISAHELKTALASDSGDETWAAILKAVDTNGDGEIDFKEFETMMVDACTDTPPPSAEVTSQGRGLVS